MAFLLVFYGLAVKNMPETEAVKATDFKAGRIIDDEVFYNPNTMTVQQIQEFLNTHVPECDTWGEKSLGYSTYVGGTYVPASTKRADFNKLMYAAGDHRYHEPPYICIDDYYENPTTHKTNFETNAVPEEGMISAAQIIYNAAHEYNINPQVLLVTLKKESYAWTDDWPTKNEYYSVMGYACPDGADCDATYRGFYNQVMMAAWQLNYYKEHIYSYGKRPYANNQILYSPDWSCGTKTVYLENIATTSLYIYTPYTPNDEALRNYPGTANCGSYGNRNFFMYFSEWFGNTLTDNSLEMVRKVYEAAGSEKGELGKAVGDFVRTNKMNWQAYEKGFIVGTEKTGYYVSTGAVRNAWARNGYENGALGLPTGALTGNSLMNWQPYQNGFIVGSDKTGYFISTGKIRSVWASTDYERGKLGKPLSDPTAENGSSYQLYEGGAIIGDGNKYYVTTTGMFEAWKNSGFKNGSLGNPTSGISSDSKMSWQSFEKGFIVGSDKTGYYPSTGKSRTVWAENGYQNGYLGRPKSNVITEKGSTYQIYEGGAIIGDGNRFFATTSQIFESWKSSGFKNGGLGNPTNGVLSSSLSKWQSFENGFIVGSDKTGYYVSSGKIRSVWASTDYERGKLGKPTSNPTKDGDVTYQSYEKGYISGNDKDGYFAVYGEIYGE